MQLRCKSLAVTSMMTAWPELSLSEWRDTCETLHRWMQIAGKITLALTPRVNQWWNVGFYPTASGIATPRLPYRDRWFEMEFKFLEDTLEIRTDGGDIMKVALAPRTVADVYEDIMACLRTAGIDVRIWTMPVEIENPIEFEKDVVHRSYDREYVLRWWRILSLSAAVLEKFRAHFIGKCSPVQLFWGTFDLACTRFSGRRGPPVKGNIIERVAFSQELIESGWWPGDSRLERPSYYSFLYPDPGLSAVKLSVPGAYYHDALKGYYLDYDDVRRSANPEALLLEFWQQAYGAAADLARWNRKELESGSELETRVGPAPSMHAGA